MISMCMLFVLPCKIKIKIIKELFLFLQSKKVIKSWLLNCSESGNEIKTIHHTFNFN